MDPRRELNLINTKYQHYSRTFGENITWFEFIPVGAGGSTLDDVYDEGKFGEGGKKYKPGVSLPTILITETEDTKRAIPEGRHPMQIVNAVLSIKDMASAGIAEPYEYQRHLNDLFFYDARYFAVSMYRVRGRVKGGDLLVVTEGLETYLDQEMPNDPGPEAMTVRNYPWPSSLPVVT